MATANPDRIKSAVLVAGIHVALAFAFIAGLRMDIAEFADAPMKLFDVAPDRPPPPPEVVAPDPAPTPEPEGAAAPPGLRAQPSPVVAPPPRVRLDVPTPVVAAPVAGTGSDARAGASDVPRPGPGAGGVGTGTGSGAGGDGSGGGGGIVSRARYVSGTLTGSDWTRGRVGGARGTRAQGTVVVRLSVGADGRVAECRVIDGSGNPDLDATTCRLIAARFRYDPARDGRGAAVADVTGWKQVWWVD